MDTCRRRFTTGEGRTDGRRAQKSAAETRYRITAARMRLGEDGRSVLESTEAEISEDAWKKLGAESRNTWRRPRREGSRFAGGVLDPAR